MNFISQYAQYKTTKITPYFIVKYPIIKIMIGSGGSEDIIIHFGKKNTNLIVKVFIYELEPGEKHSKMATLNFEIKILQFLTKKFILTNRTPHLVGLFNHQKSKNLSHLLNHTIKLKKECMTYEEKLTKKSNLSNTDHIICNLRLKSKNKIIDSNYDMALLEYCDTNLGEIISWYMNRLHRRPTLKLLNDFLYQLHRILFQIIFTLAIIQDDYPGFCHDDLFCRNILISVADTYNSDDYVEYHYHEQTFYLPANGFYAKINDFGRSVIVNQIDIDRYHPSTLKWQHYYHQNPFNHKIDIFNLLHDMYYGQNLGSNSIMDLHSRLKLPSKFIKSIKQFFSDFIDVKTIDKINQNNKDLLDDTWHIDNIPLLERTVNVPTEYLIDNTLNVFTYRPQNAQVIKIFNKR